MFAGMENDFTITSPGKLFQNWSEFTKGWNVEMRYEPIGQWNETRSKAMYNNLTDPQYGILSWMRKKRKW